MLSRIERFVHWWLQGLRYLTPRALKASGPTLPAHLVASTAADAITLALNDERGRAREQARFDPARGAEQISDWLRRHAPGNPPVILRLPAREVLAKELHLPLAAEPQLRRVLGFEVDRQTPFTSEDVYFDHRIARRDRDENRLIVTLIAAPRRTLDRALGQLEALGLRARIADTEDLPYLESGVNLLPRADDEPRPGDGFRLRLALYAALVVLVLAVAYVPVIRTDAIISELRAEIAEARSAIDEIEALKRTHDALLADLNFFREKNAAHHRMIDLLAELTDLLPDHTWVYRLEVDGANAQLQGESRNASGLLSIIENSRRLRHAEFASPITVNNSTGADRFQISAALAERTAP
jgi:general secretion pathway protein L